MVERTEEVCRTCLVGNKNMFDIFTSGNPSDTNLADMLRSFVSIKISHEEDLPHLMCSDCIKTLTTSYNFKRQCERSDILLRASKNENCVKEENIEVIIVSKDQNEYTDIIEDIDLPDENKKFKCDLCSRAFIKSGNLTIHMKTHTENNKCTFCNINFDSHQKLLVHNKENHKFFNCTYCDQSYATGNALNAHMRCHKISPLDKSEENAEYICVVGVNDASMKIKNSKFEGEIEMSEKSATVNCSQCSLPCINEDMLQLHEKIHEESHECEKCQSVFMFYSDFVEHNKKSHNMYNCSKCIKSFPTVYGLSGHSSTHIIAEANPCVMYKCSVPDCKKKYRTVEYLKQHMLLHTNENKVYLCKICGKTYNSSNSFYYHKKLHTDERPYVCTYCGNAYKIYSHLKTHMWTHSNKMPHRCSKCGKGFTRSHVLRKHIASNCGSKKRRKPVLVQDTTELFETESS